MQKKNDWAEPIDCNAKRNNVSTTHISFMHGSIWFRRDFLDVDKEHDNEVILKQCLHSSNAFTQAMLTLKQCLHSTPLRFCITVQSYRQVWYGVVGASCLYLDWLSMLTPCHYLPSSLPL